MKFAVLINRSSNNNIGGVKWDKIENSILTQLSNIKHVINYHNNFDMLKCIKTLSSQHNIKGFISAGGDGSLNILLNSIFTLYPEQTKDFFIGAIGLGSSNDFLKPFSTLYQGIPVQISTKHIKPVDIGKVTFIDKGEKKERYFIINASIGIVANANKLFNNGDVFINLFKSKFVNFTILYTALKTILKNKNLKVRITYNDVNETIPLSNLSVIKKQYISGGFRFDQRINQDDGDLGLNYMYNMNKVEIIRTLMDLKNGCFSGKVKRKTAKTKKIRIITNEPVALETDGEVQYATDIIFTIIPKAINILS